MNSSITKIYNESVGTTAPLNLSQYDGVVGRYYSDDEDGHGVMDIDSIPEHSPGPKRQFGPFVYIERDIVWDRYKY